MSSASVQALREAHISPSLSVSYRPGLHIVRGKGQYLFAKDGTRYTDFVNNVAHLGHSHPAVTAAAAAQLDRLNTNTRYYHESLGQVASELTATFPPELSVVFFVNSGSEANELAVRLARAATRHATDLICVDYAYHGNTQTCIDVSPYKFAAPGGRGRMPHVHVASSPDEYRYPPVVADLTAARERFAGPGQGGDVFSEGAAGAAYAEDVQRCVLAVGEREPSADAFPLVSLPSLQRLAARTPFSASASAAPTSAGPSSPTGPSEEGEGARTGAIPAAAASASDARPDAAASPPATKRARLAGFIVESFLGCAGQVPLPQGYLSAAFRHVRAAGGVCIVDEVQVGFGRLGGAGWRSRSEGASGGASGGGGEAGSGAGAGGGGGKDLLWGFQTQRDLFGANAAIAGGRRATSSSSPSSPSCECVVPDIVTLGKPMGNGWPLGAVVTTPWVAARFHTGMEWFNTFGGSTASCAVGLAALRALRADGLVANARRVGAHLGRRLGELQTRHPRVVGDVRGAGLFFGVELVRDRSSKTPAADECSFVVNHCAHESHVLVSSDGPLHNVIKLKPPMCVTEADVDVLVAALDRALAVLAQNDYRAPAPVRPDMPRAKL